MKVFRYPMQSLTGDYLRAAIGLAVGLAVLLTAPPSIAVSLIFGSISVLFLVFGLRTYHRQTLRIAVTEDEIRWAGIGTRALSWDALELLKLRYYGTRRQRNKEAGGGFMQLTLKGGNASLNLESSIHGFEYIAWRAVKAARENGVGLDPTSANNLLELGIDANSDQAAPTVEQGVQH